MKDLFTAYRKNSVASKINAMVGGFVGFGAGLFALVKTTPLLYGALSPVMSNTALAFSTTAVEAGLLGGATFLGIGTGVVGGFFLIRFSYGCLYGTQHCFPEIKPIIFDEEPSPYQRLIIPGSDLDYQSFQCGREEIASSDVNSDQKSEGIHMSNSTDKLPLEVNTITFCYDINQSTNDGSNNLSADEVTMKQKLTIN